MNKIFGQVDISDPHTFLSIKRGILQYAWIKPILAIATIAMKATGTFKDGIISVESGYFWTAFIYNVSICWSLYDLALFWVCMSADLQPFRPMPKFLCIKGIIFASWWQGFFLSLLVFLGAIPSIGGGYTADNVAVAIQDALICFEMPLFAIAHWYAFSWKDYADRTISDARMPMRYAFRDAFGPRDLIEDAKDTWSGQQYEYRYFDAEDNVIAHEASSSRRARMAEGMRYERGGRGKYWLPAPDGANSKQPLLSRWADSHARTMSPGNRAHQSPPRSQTKGYGTNDPEEPELDAEVEQLYTNARALEFGDWNYPVINTHYATREDRLHTEPGYITASTNRALFQPTKANKQRRKSRIKEIKEDVHQAESSSSHHRGSSSSDNTSVSFATKGKERLQSMPVVGPILERAASSSSSASNKSHSSQLVDLVVEDKEAKEIERVRARKEGGPGWNSVEQKHFVKTYPDEDEAEEVRQGFNPDAPELEHTDEGHTLIEAPSHETQGTTEVAGRDETGAKQPWEERRYPDAGTAFEDEREVWGR